MTPARSFALLFGAQFAGFGAMMPFLPAILAEGGLTVAQVGAVVAAGSVARLLAAPLGGRLADAAGDMRRVVALAALLAAATALGFGLLAGLAALLVVHLLHSLVAAPVMPLSDALALRAVREGRFDYARVRALGSVAFMLGALAAGLLAEHWGPRVAAWMLAAGLLGTAIAAWRLPPTPRLPAGATTGGGLWAPLRQPGFARLLLLCAAVQGSHAMYYGFSTLHWQAAGLGTGFIGALWALGVLAEVGLFLVGGRVAAALGVRGLAVLAALAGTVRWVGTAFTVDPAALVALQLLHGATFGAMHLAAMRALLALPPGLAGRAQSLLAATVSAGSGVLIWASGGLYGAFGGLAFLAMAALCLAALPLAWRVR